MKPNFSQITLILFFGILLYLNSLTVAVNGQSLDGASSQGSILKNSISAENISDKFSFSNFWTHLCPKIVDIPFFKY
jgi:hypothetical protein